MAGTSGKRVKQVSEDEAIPSGIITDVLSRLPVQAIRSYRTVSKNWHDSMTNKFFARMQFARSSVNPSYFVCPVMAEKMKVYSMNPESFNLRYLNTIDPQKRSQHDFMYTIASFNGLLCCINLLTEEDTEEDDDIDLQIWIVNPCMGETLLLPQGTPPSFGFVPNVGVAYVGSEYKVFRIFCAGKEMAGYRFECEVYSSSSGSWRNIGTVPCVPMGILVPFKSRHVFVAGKIYWLSCLDAPGKVLSVDWEGRFDVIPLPKYDPNLRYEDSLTEVSHLLNLRGCLALFVQHVEYMDIWTWKEDIEPSGDWVLEYVDYAPIGDFDLVFAVTSLKNHILCLTDNHWCCYDVDTGKWNKKRVKKPLSNPSVFPFTESVLPCDGSVTL
ncbi:unnamed protein product [Microthlaspi erraticum]|uniref:F-box associated beta-propeller type 1 domain-containing protein n=1 Tax=Microthlaspi erraticum TaxID=1685480 RepID=A0A6D2HBS2_9BRAS|nr:unnamed protein product [Microthlaspi erraticum]